MPESWYEVVGAEIPLTQGDLIFECPLLTWSSANSPTNQPSSPEPALADLIRAFREDIVVMTQACDREHQKVSHVVLCPHVSLSDFRRAWEAWMIARNQAPSERAWKRACEDVANGYVWNQA